MWGQLRVEKSVRVDVQEKSIEENERKAVQGGSENSEAAEVNGLSAKQRRRKQSRRSQR